MDLRDKTIIITGASGGIGKQIVYKLASHQCNLCLIGRDKVKLQDIMEKINESPSKAHAYPCDLKNESEIESTIKKIKSDFSSFDILINIAGIWQKVMPLEEIKKDTVEDVISTNLIALIHMCRLCLPTLKTRQEAAIINISSKSGVVAQSGQSVYSASKYGVRGFTEVLKADLKGSNVKVAGVYQSGTSTQMFSKTGDNFPLEKFTDPADLADTIVFMLTRPPKIWIHDIRVEY